MLHQALCKPCHWVQLLGLGATGGLSTDLCRKSKGQQLSGQCLKVTVGSYWEENWPLVLPADRGLGKTVPEGLCSRNTAPDLPTAMTSACWGSQVIRSSRNVTVAELSHDAAGMRQTVSGVGLPLTFPVSLKDDHPWTLMEECSGSNINTAVPFVALQVWGEVSLHVRCLWTRSAWSGDGERTGAGLSELHPRRGVLSAARSLLRNHCRVPHAAGAGRGCCR